MAFEEAKECKVLIIGAIHWNVNTFFRGLLGGIFYPLKSLFLSKVPFFWHVVYL